MWKFKAFGQKEPAGLEGRHFDVGNLKLQIRNLIAEGGFSSVYLARDTLHASKQYALKHIICNDSESLELTLKEISVMQSLKGHPNVVTLHAHAILDMGRTKEALLVMEFCDKSLVSVLENRGSGYFEEKQALSIFRDVCNAVFGMHCQSPPIAHRDLKAENLLLGSNGSWKLCDFGSTSTNHKRFEKPEEMGIEEDNIRKHTTPAYRPPEMWDLFRRDPISEKVDIWALGCLLFRICYFKNAFDGESKLQILNGNYRIPDLPKYSSFVTDLIREMLQASPDDRPDITQVWFRVNEVLPANLQKSLPDTPPEVESTRKHEGASRPGNRTSPMPRKSPSPRPSPPSSEASRNVTKSSPSSGVEDSLGAFWSTQHAKNSLFPEEKSRPKFDEEPSSVGTLKQERIQPEDHPLPKNTNIMREENAQTNTTRRNSQGKSQKPEQGPSKDFELTFSQKDAYSGTERMNAPNSGTTFQNDAFNTFVAEFDTNKLSPGVNHKSAREEALEADIVKLKEQVKQVNLEKAEMTSRCEKLSAICRSQRQEMQELKQALSAKTSPSPVIRDASQNQASPGTQLREKIEGTVWELPQDQMDWRTQNAEPKQWQAFADDSGSRQQSTVMGTTAQSVREKYEEPNKQATQASSGVASWGFGTEAFMAIPATSPQISSGGNSSQSFVDSKVKTNQASPAGWAGF